MDVVRKLILERLQELGLTMSEASLKIGKNHAYLQQFLKRGYPLELPEKSRIPLAQLLGVSEDILRGASSSLPVRNHNKQETKTPSRKGDIAQSFISDREPQNFIDSVRAVHNMSDHVLPVYGTTQTGKDGTMIVTARPVDGVDMPDFLARVDGAYGMIISGNSMDPEMKSGSTALINPHLPPRIGDTCIFRCRKDDVELAMVRQLKNVSDTIWSVHQHNPKKDFPLKRSEWPICHVAVGNYFRR
jgi:phage repressor protein C with HTH and peptisase S24 domain